MRSSRRTNTETNERHQYSLLLRTWICTLVRALHLFENNRLRLKKKSLVTTRKRAFSEVPKITVKSWPLTTLIYQFHNRNGFEDCTHRLLFHRVEPILFAWVHSIVTSPIKYFFSFMVFCALCIPNFYMLYHKWF